MISFVLTTWRLVKALFSVMKMRLFWAVFTTLALILLSGTLFYHQTEGWALLDAFYFAFISLMPTSVDTGMAPTASLSKVFTMIYLIVGMGVMLAMILIIGRAVIKFEKEEEARK